MRLLVPLLVVICAAVTSARKSYQGYQLLQIYPVGKEQWTLISNLQQDIEIDFWAEASNHVDIFVPPRVLPRVKKLLLSSQIKYKVVSDRIQQDIDEEFRRLSTRERNGKAINYDDFNTFTDIIAELDVLAASCASGVTCSTFTFGTSYEGRPLKGLQIGSGDGTKKGIWLDATIHAREWLSTATLLKITQHLVVDYGIDPEVTSLVDTYDFYLTPVANPDGYEFTWTNDRLWRKNRRDNPGSACVGVDLNRNFEEMWGNAGTSTVECSETYGGPSAASEVETQAIQNRIASIGSTLLTSIHFHTYGQLWLIPWGSTTITGACNFADDDAEMLVVANAAADAIENTWGTRWERGNSCATIYPASGITMDYDKARAGVKYTATPELRGNSFVIAADQIDPSFQEVWNGITAAVGAIPQ